MASGATPRIAFSFKKGSSSGAPVQQLQQSSLSSLHKQSQKLSSPPAAAAARDDAAAACDTSGCRREGAVSAPVAAGGGEAACGREEKAAGKGSAAALLFQASLAAEEEEQQQAHRRGLLQSVTTASVIQRKDLQLQQQALQEDASAFSYDEIFEDVSSAATTGSGSRRTGRSSTQQRIYLGYKPPSDQSAAAAAARREESIAGKKEEKRRGIRGADGETDSSTRPQMQRDSVDQTKTREDPHAEGRRGEQQQLEDEGEKQKETEEEAGVLPASRFIGKLQQAAWRRQLEREIIQEKLLQRQQEADTQKGEVFVTAAYKRRLEERKQLALQLEQQEARDTKHAVEKQKDLFSFHAHLLRSGHGSRTAALSVAGSHLQQKLSSTTAPARLGFDGNSESRPAATATATAAVAHGSAASSTAVNPASSSSAALAAGGGSATSRTAAAAGHPSGEETVQRQRIKPEEVEKEEDEARAAPDEAAAAANGKIPIDTMCPRASPPHTKNDQLLPSGVVATRHSREEADTSDSTSVAGRLRLRQEELQAQTLANTSAPAPTGAVDPTDSCSAVAGGQVEHTRSAVEGSAGVDVAPRDNSTLEIKRVEREAEKTLDDLLHGRRREKQRLAEEAAQRLGEDKIAEARRRYLERKRMKL